MYVLTTKIDTARGKPAKQNTKGLESSSAKATKEKKPVSLVPSGFGTLVAAFHLTLQHFSCPQQNIKENKLY